MALNPVQARFAKDYDITPHVFSQLAKRVRHAARMQERVHNEKDDVDRSLERACDDAVKRVDEYAKQYDMTVRWDDGLYPSFAKGEHDRLLPLD
jgi:hypothetical protein